MKIFKFLLIFAIKTILFVGCKTEPLEGDDEAPVIEIITPIDNVTFHLENVSLSSNSIEIHARATDNNAVVFGVFTITDANGNLVDADVESNFSENNKVLDLTGNFSTTTPGVYSINFLFRDANDNNASTTITIECIASETEEEQAINYQLFYSDRQYESIMRVEIYNDATTQETLLSKDVTDGKSLIVFPEYNELLVGSTESGLDVNITSVNPSTGGREIKNVSTSNYIFSALAKNQTKQEVYYFLEGADLNKIGNHRLYKMNADGSNKTMLAQVENATRANAIKKIWVEDSEQPFLIMHDRYSLYYYDPESSTDLESSAIFKTDGHEIHDIAVDVSNDIIYMILSYDRGSSRYYTVGTSSLKGLDVNLNFAEIAQNHPVTSQFLPHRMKLDIKNKHVYWFTESDDYKKSILKRASFNDTSVQTIWETTTCLCTGEVEDIRIEDYQINTESIITTN